jgi:hypothetical protein
VSTKEILETDAMQVTFDKDGRVFFHIKPEKDASIKLSVIRNLNSTRNLNLTEAEMQNFVRTEAIGVPYTGLKQLLSMPVEQQANLKQPGIPVDTTGGELYYWIRDAASAFSGKSLKYFIKGDNNAKYPIFKGVLTAFKRNEILKFNMITMMEDVPSGTDLSAIRSRDAK